MGWVLLTIRIITGDGGRDRGVCRVGGGGAGGGLLASIPAIFSQVMRLRLNPTEGE